MRGSVSHDDTGDRGRGESILGADVLGALVRELDLEPIALIPGSGGALAVMIATSQHPELISQSYYDLAHPRRTGEWLHALIRGSRLVEPPSWRATWQSSSSRTTRECELIESGQ